MQRPSITTAVWTIAIVVVLFFLQAASGLMIPVALAILISYALAPLVGWLQDRGVPISVAAGLVILLVIGLGTAGVYALRDDATALAAQVPRAVERARDFVRSTLGPGGQIQIGTDEQPAAAAGQVASTLVQWTVSAVVVVAGDFIVVMFLIYFLLISGHHVRNRIVEITGVDRERRRMAATIIDDINRQIQRYLLVLLVTGVIVGLATWLVLVWMAVPQAAGWGLVAGVLNSIPYFGPVIVTGGLFVAALVQGGGVAHALQISAASLVITSLEGWLLTPALMGKAERMSALAVFLGLLLWTWVWGAWGTVLAVPMLVVIKSVADHVGALKPLGRLMAP
jgi:predicted PurR-regulated permease PerM